MTEVNRNSSQTGSDDDAQASCLGTILSKSLESVKSVPSRPRNDVFHEIPMTPSGSQERVTNGSWGHLAKLGRQSGQPRTRLKQSLSVSELQPMLRPVPAGLCLIGACFPGLMRANLDTLGVAHISNLVPCPLHLSG